MSSAEQRLSRGLTRLSVLFAKETYVNSIARASSAEQPRFNAFVTSGGGIIAVLVGLFLLVWPGMTAVLLVAGLAVYWLIGGFIKVIRAMRQRDENWVWDVIGAVLSIFVGAVVVVNVLAGTIIAVELLYVALGVAGLIAGIFEIVTGIRQRSWGHALLGVAEMALGILLFAEPVAGLQLVKWLAGIGLIVAGFGWLIAAYQRD
jgi:uncharacterized membrane protein HdeD (DUF308 family)